MKKMIIFILIFVIIPLTSEAVTLEEYQNAMANVSISASTTYKDEFVYSYYWGGTPSNPINEIDRTTAWLKKAYNGIKSSGYKYGTMKSKAGIHGSFKDKFAVYCETFVKLMIYHVSGGTLEYGTDFDRIDVSEIRKGDFIHFPNHIAIFIDDNGDDQIHTNIVSEASGTIKYGLRSRTPDYGYRIKQSSLSKINYNQLMASYDFHDRLDDYAPIIYDVKQEKDQIIINASDYKKYELAEKSDILEPENNGIVGYQITTSNIEPTKWIKINKAETLNNKFPGVTKKGTYYIWVIDVGGNVASKVLNAIDYIEDINNIGVLNYEVKSNEIKVILENTLDSDGIKKYNYYLNDNLIESTSTSEFVFTNLESNKSYSIYYEIVDNKDNVYKSNIYEIKTSKNVNSFKLTEDVINIKVGQNYQIKYDINANIDNYVINYFDYDKKIILVSSEGIITPINEGVTYVNISVEDYLYVLKVNVIKDEVIIDNNQVPNDNNKNIDLYQVILIILIIIIAVIIITLIINLKKENYRK